MTGNPDVTGPDPLEETKRRYVMSYGQRRAYAENPLNTAQFPPAVAGVTDFIDIHAHAHKRQQDGLALAKHASASGMRALMLKTLPDHHNPMSDLVPMQEELKAWTDANEVAPTRLFAGFITEVYLG